MARPWVADGGDIMQKNIKAPSDASKEVEMNPEKTKYCIY
jgi:hypothetical protein